MRPGEVINNAAGVKDCENQCRNLGKIFYGFECPRATVFCQCADTLAGSTEKPSSDCDRKNVASSHCVGPFTHGEGTTASPQYLMGSHGTGSVYLVLPIQYSSDFNLTASDFYNGAKFTGALTNAAAHLEGGVIEGGSNVGTGQWCTNPSACILNDISFAIDGVYMSTYWHRWMQYVVNPWIEIRLDAAYSIRYIGYAALWVEILPSAVDIALGDSLQGQVAWPAGKLYALWETLAPITTDLVKLTHIQGTSAGISANMGGASEVEVWVEGKASQVNAWNSMQTTATHWASYKCTSNMRETKCPTCSHFSAVDELAVEVVTDESDKATWLKTKFSSLYAQCHIPLANAASIHMKVSKMNVCALIRGPPNTWYCPQWQAATCEKPNHTVQAHKQAHGTSDATIGECLMMKKLTCRSCSALNATGANCMSGQSRKCRVEKTCTCHGCSHACQMDKCADHCATA